MTPSHGIRSHRLLLVLPAVVAALTLGGCAVVAPQQQERAQSPAAQPADSTASASPSPSPSAQAASAAPSVPGYDVGEFPPVPLFVLPDLSLLDGSASQFTIDTSDAFADIPGVTVSAAECDADGAVISGEGTTYLYGDGAGQYIGPDGLTQNFGDGSGKRIGGDVLIENFGDGSGTYIGGDVLIENHGDGSGTYIGDDRTIEIFGDGSGKFIGGDVIIENHGDGSGKYVGDDMIIENHGDGSGKFVGDSLIIQNHGDGTGTVDGVAVEMAELPPVPRLGVFPPLDALSPIESCGTVITFQDGVLFDFDRSEIRPDAADALERVAGAFADAEVERAIVAGHTDSVDTDEYNQELSERRANAVADALRGRGVTADLAAEGYGESRPVAANEVDGVDNPAGRQLNRRVEIFIPAAG